MIFNSNTVAKDYNFANDDDIMTERPRPSLFLADK